MLRRKIRAAIAEGIAGKLVRMVNGIALSAEIAAIGIMGYSTRERNAMKSHKFLIGVDPSITNTGVVILDPGGTLFGCCNAGAFGKDRSLPEIQRHINQRDRIVNFLESLGVFPGKNTVLAWEDYSFNSTHKAYSLAEYNGVLKSSLFNYSPNPIIYVPPLRLKKFATGNGHADKNMMIARAKAECAELGDKPTSDICDAFFLAKYAFYISNARKACERDMGHTNLRVRLEMTIGANGNE